MSSTKSIDKKTRQIASFLVHACDDAIFKY